MLKLRPRLLYNEPLHPLRRFCFRLVNKPQWAQWRKHRALYHDARKSDSDSRPSFDERLYHGNKFEAFILLCIAVNTLIFITRHRGQPAWYDNFIDTSSIIFTSVFVLEAAIKLTAFGKRYFKAAWNRFDFFICVMGVTELFVILGGWFSFIPAGTLSAFRAIRVVRVLRLTKRLSALRKIISTLYFSLPQLANVALLLGLAIFAFAVIGIDLLGKAPEPGPYGGVDRQSNFQTFPRAALTLFAAISGENWSDLMWDYRYFAETGQLDGWQPGWALAFWSLYMVTMAYMLLSVFVAVLMEAFEDVREQSQLPIGGDVIKHFALEWSAWDPRCTHFIPVRHLGMLVSTLRKPLAPEGLANDRGKVMALVSALRVPVRDGRVHYVEVLLSLAEQLYWEAAQLPPSAQLIVDRMAMQWLRLYPTLKGMAPVECYSDEPETLEHILETWDGLTSRAAARRRISVAPEDELKQLPSLVAQEVATDAW
ncbi:Ion transport protein-domain-containing protein [Pavlovales sp. CCMP2436]|nr:Ion transport protein-domain-containing protein [Pavlovales sp. CCMP2436]